MLCKPVISTGAISVDGETSAASPDDPIELGREGWFIAKNQYIGHSLAVFTSGGDAQGISIIGFRSSFCILI